MSSSQCIEYWKYTFFERLVAFANQNIKKEESPQSLLDYWLLIASSLHEMLAANFYSSVAYTPAVGLNNSNRLKISIISHSLSDLAYNCEVKLVRSLKSLIAEQIFSWIFHIKFSSSDNTRHFQLVSQNAKSLFSVCRLQSSPQMEEESNSNENYILNFKLPSSESLFYILQRCLSAGWR